MALFEGQDGIDKRLVFFEKGIALAKEMKNEYLLMAAYRKNIMLSSAHGLFDVTNYYYYKSMEIVGDTDPFKLADIYNGLGYISCAVEQYERANGYYNRAIEIFYRLGMMNYVGETLYNMAMNCMLAGDHETAYVYLQNCMKIVNTLHLNDLRVCNISKIFGLLALCAYKLNLFFNCRVYLDNSLQFLSHVLNREKSGEKGGSLDLSYTACDDDIFLYYYVEALLKMDAGDLEKALFYMQTAQVYVERSIGNQFFSKVQFALSFAKLYRLMGREDEAHPETGIGLCQKMRCNGEIPNVADRACGARERNTPCRAAFGRADTGRDPDGNQTGRRFQKLFGIKEPDGISGYLAEYAGNYWQNTRGTDSNCPEYVCCQFQH